MSVTHQILFIQGGGAGAYKADQQLVVSLRRALKQLTSCSIQRCRMSASLTIGFGKHKSEKSWAA